MKRDTDKFGDVLDAYGHLTWTVNMRPSKDGGDWMACFDARRMAGGIEYHVIVNSDSGGFIDTFEHRTVPIEKVKPELFNLVEYWHNIGSNYGRMYSCKKTSVSWRKHLKSLMLESEPEVLDEGDEDICWYESPQEMGWVGRDGRP